jgi:hypothetical protein
MEAHVTEAQFPATTAELLLPVGAQSHRGVVTSHRVLPDVAEGPGGVGEAAREVD